MANKKNKKAGLTGHDILIAILAAGACGLGAFLISLGVGGFITTRPQEGQTIEAPSEQPSYHGTLPSRTPESTPTPAQTDSPEEPSNEPTPEQTDEPAQQTPKPVAPQTQAPQTQAPAAQTQAPTQAPASTPAPTRTPTVPVQTPAPVVTVPPVQNTPAPTQAGNAGTIQNSDGTYTHDFSGGRVLATRESNNNNDPVYHTKDCRSAKKIPPENELWYSSAQAAQGDGRRLCGNCGR